MPRAVNAEKELEDLEKKILRLKKKGEPVPLETEEYRLELVASMAPQDKKPALMMQLFKLRDREDQDVGFKMHDLPKEVLKKLTDFKDAGIVPYHPSME